MLGFWGGVGFWTMFLIGFAILAGWFVPPSPSLDAGQVAAMFQEHRFEIRLGMCFMLLGAACYLPYTVLMSDLIKQIEGKSFFLSGTQLAAGTLASVTLFLPPYLWLTAAFRADRDPALVQTLNDLAFLFFITPFPPFILQYVCFAIAIFTDRSPSPMFPRWLGYLLVWVFFSSLPAFLAFFFKTGPFAWNGLFVWWIPLSLFGVWVVAMLAFCRRAVLRPYTPA